MTGRCGVVANGIHQGPADPPTLPVADDGDHLALPADRVVGEQANGPPAVGGDKTGQDGGVDRDAPAGHGDVPERVPQSMRNPAPVSAFYGAYAYHGPNGIRSDSTALPARFRAPSLAMARPT